MKRSDINPWEWSKAFGFSQAVQVSEHEQVLFCSGQTAVGPDGAPPTTSDMGEQVTTVLANLRTVLEGAGMGFADIIRLTLYATDVDALFAAAGSMGEALAPNLPAMTVIGVSRLAFPELLVEIEATAAHVAATGPQDRSCSTERMLPAGSVNQAMYGPPPRKMPLSSVSMPS